MNRMKGFPALVLFAIGTMLVLLLALWMQPSDAVRKPYQGMIELGLIDAIKSPEEVGLEYLQHRPPQLTADLVENIGYLRDRAESELPDNVALAIPLGTTSPFGVGALSNDDGSTLEKRNFEGVGFVNSAGIPESIAVSNIVGMFSAEVRNRGTFDAVNPEEMVVADASGSWSQTRRVAVIDLICRNKENNRYYILPNARVDSLCRDALNAVSNRTWSMNSRDLGNLQILP